MPQLDPIMEAANRRLAGDDPGLTEALKSDIFVRPGKRNVWSRYGAVEETERSDALRTMGLTSQLVFPSVGADRFVRTKDIEVVYGGGVTHTTEAWRILVRMIRRTCPRSE